MVAADGSEQHELRFHRLYQANFRPVQAYAVNRLGPADDVPDVVAEVFTTAWRRLADVPPPPGPLARPARSHVPRGPVSSGFAKDWRPGVVLAIRPSAIPHGMGLYLEAWAAKPGTKSGPTLSLQTGLVQAGPRCTGR